MSLSRPDLDALEAALARKAALAESLARVRATRLAEEGRRTLLAARLRSEKGALDAIEGFSARAVLAALTGRLGARRERQRAAYHAARRAYDAWASGVADLQAREAALDAEWLALHGAEAALEAALTSLEEGIVRAGGETGAILAAVSGELRHARAEAGALDAAADAGAAAGGALDALRAALDEAEQAARADMAGDGSWVSSLTDQRIQRARAAAVRAHNHLLRLRTAVSAVKGAEVRLPSGLRNPAYAVDAELADWIVHRRLRDAQERAAGTRREVKMLTIDLRARATVFQERVEALDAERRALIRGEWDA